MKKWESKTIEAVCKSKDDIDGLICNWGQLGWENVSVLPNCFLQQEFHTDNQLDPDTVEGGAIGISLLFIFKRTIPETVEESNLLWLAESSGPNHVTTEHDFRSPERDGKPKDGVVTTLDDDESMES